MTYSMSNSCRMKRLHLKRKRRKGRKFAQQNKGQIKLNIGGTPFQTTLTSLSKLPSMLNTMFNGLFQVEKDETGAVFIDRDGMFYACLC